MDFFAGVLEGNVSLGCDPATWKAYLSCLVGLMDSRSEARDVEKIGQWIERVA